MTDYGRALEKAREFKELLLVDKWFREHARQGQPLAYQMPNGDLLSREEVRLRIIRLQHLVETIAEDVEPDGNPNRFEQTHYQSRWNWRGALEATVRLIGILENQEEREAILGPKGPVLAADGLHEWVWAAVKDLWDDGHYMEAVHAAATEVEKQTQTKLNRTDLIGAELFTDAFKTDAPKPNKPRLRFAHIEETSGSGDTTPAWTSAHEGARSFGRGCSQGIRNPTAHGTADLTEQQALEYLAALSVLARWVDAADVVEASTDAEG